MPQSIRVASHDVRLVASLLCLFCLGQRSPVRAMSDGGYVARLVAFTGEPVQFAVVAYEHLQETCESFGCQFFVVDLRARAFRRQQVRRIAPPTGKTATIAELFASYRESLSKLWQGRLEPAQMAGNAKSSSLRVEEHSTKAILTTKDVRYVATLRVNSRVASMTPYDRRDPNQDCFRYNPRRPACSGCRVAERTLDDEVLTTYVCRRRAGTTKQSNGEARPCHCYAEANIMRFVVVNSRTNRVWLGNRFLVAPYDIHQDPQDLSLVLSSIQAYPTSEAILFIGSVANAPTWNGTFFPVVAVVARDP